MGQLYEQIAAAPGGRVSYADYMNMALYDAQAGYYMRERTKIGRKGDFITNSSFAAVFGKALASFFIRIVERGGLPPAICEWGAGMDVWRWRYWKNGRKKALIHTVSCRIRSSIKACSTVKGSGKRFARLPIKWSNMTTSPAGSPSVGRFLGSYSAMNFLTHSRFM